MSLLTTRFWALGTAMARIIRACAVSRRASAAVEFAFVLPIALGLYIGAAEVSQGVMTSRKVNLLTRTLVDLLSEQATSTSATSPTSGPYAVTATTLSNLMSAAQMLLTPQPLTTLQMTLSAIDLTNNSIGFCCVAKVRWSYTQGGTLRPCNVSLTSTPDGQTNSPNTMPASLMPFNTVLPGPISILIADVNYTYQPAAGFSVQAISKFTPTFARNEYMFPRTTGQVLTGPLPSTGTQTGQVCY